MSGASNQAEVNVIRLAYKIHKNIEDKLKSKIGEKSTDRKQLAILLCIDELEAPTPSLISKHTGIGTSRISRLLDILEIGNKIQRLHDENDRRKITIRLLPAGEEMVMLCKHTLTTLSKSLLSSLTMEEKKALAVILGTFSEK